MPKIKSYRKEKKISPRTRLKLFLFRRKNKKRKFKKTFKKIFILVIWLGIIGFIGLVSVFAYFAKDLPNPEQITERRIVESTKIYDRTGKILLYDVHGEEKRTVIPFTEIPQQIKNATLVIEDDNFYHHFGIDFAGILRSFLRNIQGKTTTLQGGSTITQQFIKNAILTPEKTYTRKIKEAILAIEMEIKYSKDEIFDFYLNQVPYGSNAYGIEAAAQTFFNKNAKDLTVAESALLASLTQAPSYFSPYGSHFDELKWRQEYILERMLNFGYITEEEFKKAKEEELKFAPVASTIKAPHFIMYIKEYLEKKYGKEYIEKAGLIIHTTLDWDLQQLAEEIVFEGVNKNAKNFNAHNAALTAIDPKTGQILAMVGSKDYFGETYPENCSPGKNCLFEPNVNVNIRSRQPGSSFKPFAYAAAFQKGFTPNTIVFDLETEFAVEGAPSYKPQNYNGKFSGPVTLREALARSLNVPSVKTLYLAGVNETINIAQDMGISTLKDRSRFGLSLVLGGGEVRLIEEAAAFGVFANEGKRNQLASIIKIEDSSGKMLEEYKNNSKKILEPQITRLISDILSDEATRASVFGSKSKLYLEERPVAAKTGTTQEYRDGWTIGYTPSLVVGVWAGNNDNTPMKEGAGIYVAAPIWNEFMKQAYEFKKENPPKADQSQANYFDLPKEPEEFKKPNLVEAEKDILNGKFITGEEPYRQIHCILYYIDKKDPQDDNNGKNDSQFNNWEEPVLKWAKSLGYDLNKQQPIEEDDDDTNISKDGPEVKITSPGNNNFIYDKNIKIKAEINSRLNINKVEFFFDNELIETKYESPYYIDFIIPNNKYRGLYTIKVKAYDGLLNMGMNEVRIGLLISGD